MSTRSTSTDLVPHFSDPESVIRNHQRNLCDPSLLLDFEEINMPNNNNQGPPPVSPKIPAPDLRPVEELLQAPTDGVGDAIVVPPRILAKAPQERPQGALPSDTVPTPRGEIKAITTRSGIVLAGPSVPPPPLSSSSFSKEVEQDPEMITDQVLPESTTRVPPPIVQPSPSSRSFEIPLSPSSLPSELPKRNPHQPPIPYPSRLNKEKLQDNLEKALAVMTKYAKMLKDLLSNKEKLLGLANTSLTENCSAVLLKKLPEKLRDPRKFLIPYNFPDLKKCMALADLGAIINLMPLYVWKKLMLPDLIPTCMTLELANRSIAYPAGIIEDVCVQVGKFTFPADLVVIDYDVDPRVSLILGRPFLRTTRALVDEIRIIIFDPEAHLREIEYLLNQDLSTDSSPTTDIDIIDLNLERFTDEPALVYSFTLGDEDDDLLTLSPIM
ncbi:reverse transcriptase domain-containing protein [Tanacetum coccineum]|uniref:Reverse transcriptase domain-containing protein n=1 Tax=Tanacetum coccineum TaxID=301880 RepID=A0ABQ5BS28_9ASTR